MRHRLATTLALLALAACARDSSGPSDSPSTRGGGDGGQALPETRSGYIFGRNGQPMRVTYLVREGVGILEGDILLGAADSIPATPDALRRRASHPPRGLSLGVVIDGSAYRWPGGVVPYEIDPALPSPSRVTDAIGKIHASVSGVRLVPRSGQADYVRFVPISGSVCYSYLGRSGGMQTIQLAPGCAAGHTIHEITHALGLFHEQSRCDRDSYVEILYANIQAGFASQFDKHCPDATDLFEYAEGSIMHYSPYAFSANGQPTIRSLRGLDALMGQRSGYGSTDIATVNSLYPGTGGVWVAKASLPTPRKHLAVGSINGVLYAVGGATGAGTPLTKVEAFNPGTNSWNTRASLPAPRWRTNGAVTINNVLYLPGGLATTHTRTLYAYSPFSNGWTTKAQMPVAGGCGGSAVISSIMYVLVGCDATTSPTSGAKGILLRYDPATNTWSTRAPSPTPHQFPAVAAVGGKLYVIGGKNGSGVTTATGHVYNPATNTWSTKAPLPAARLSATAHALGSRIYVVGGNDALGGYSRAVYAYDPASNTWKAVASMLTARATLGSATTGGILYAIGGASSSTTALGTTEAYTP